MLQSLDSLIAFVTIMTICSMFVLIVVQMIASALSLRGKNMANALALTFQTLAPSLEGDAHKLAQKILSDPIFSDSMLKTKNKPATDAAADASQGSEWKLGNISRSAMHLASDIRPGEVYAALKSLAAQDGSLKASAQKVLDAAGKDSPSNEAAKQKIEALGKLLDLAIPEEQKNLLKQTISATAGDLIKNIDGAQEHLESWFKSAQDRAQQWFQAHTRSITIGVSIVFTFVCQWDAVEIFKLVSTNAVTRDALVKASGEVAKMGDAGTDAKGGIIHRITSAWNSNKDHAGIQLNEAGVQHTDELRRQVENTTSPDKEKLLQDFDQLVADQTTGYYKDEKAQLANLESVTKQAGFALIPDGGVRWGDGSGNNWFTHLPGMLLFAALLTLGAPYWFNMLARLASLRSALSETIGDESKDKKKKSDKPATL